MAGRASGHGSGAGTGAAGGHRRWLGPVGLADGAGALEAIAQRGRDMAEGVWFVLVFVQGPCALAMFLLGLAAHRTGYLATVAQHPARLRRWMVCCLPVGVAGALFYASTQGGGSVHSPEHVGLAALAVDLATAPVLTFGYVALLLWLLQ